MKTPEDRAAVFAVVWYGGSFQEELREVLQNDREFFLYAVTRDWRSLWYASVDLKNDPEIVLLAAAQNPRILEDLGDEAVRAPLLKDRDFALALVSKKGSALEYLREFQDDPVVARAAINQNGYASNYIGKVLKQDPEFKQKR